jgi:S-adenosylmethionine decarboxylase
MEVVFRSDLGPADGLRVLTRPQLDILCERAKCTIVSHITNNHLDSYVLSESSLFVYKHKLIMKTCGTTTLLRCLSYLFEQTDALGMKMSYLGYSRKNLIRPNAQHWPHASFEDEIKFLSTEPALQDRLRGNGHILGPITGDHWFVYVADHQNNKKMDRNNNATTTTTAATTAVQAVEERTINMMMFDMAPEVASCFYQSENGMNGEEMTRQSGIVYLCPGATIDSLAFTPCGYSMNAILHDSYFTIHITPEPSCSYVSFETNTLLSDYSALVRNVLSVFRPKRFVLTMFGNQEGFEQLKNLPMKEKNISVGSSGNYSRSSCSSTQVELDLGCWMACYSLNPSSSSPLVTTTKGKKGTVVAERSERGLSHSTSLLSLSDGTSDEESDAGSVPLPSHHSQEDCDGAIPFSSAEKNHTKKERSFTWC